MMMNRDIICHEDLHVHAVKEFEGQINVLDLLENRRILTAGYSAVMHIHSAVEEIVITELIETMQDQLQNSKRVKLNGFGAFKIGIENAHGGAPSADKFDARKDIKGLHVLFQPEVKTDTSGQRQKTFISGCSVQEAPKNDVDTSKPKTDNGSGSGD